LGCGDLVCIFVVETLKNELRGGCYAREGVELVGKQPKGCTPYLVFGAGASGGGNWGLGGDFEEGGAVGALDVFAAGGLGDDEDGAALEVGTHDADVFDRIHKMNLQ
jgi:hypothetical protein